MANPEILDNLNRTLIPASWSAHCLAQLNSSADFTWREGVVDRHGDPVSGLTDGYVSSLLMS